MCPSRSSRKAEGIGGAERTIGWIDALKLIASSDLPPGLRDTLRTMMTWWNSKTGQLWPSINSIARASGRNISTERRRIRELEALGVLTLLDRSKGGTTNHWRINFEALAPGTVPESTRAESVGRPAQAQRATRAAYGENSGRLRGKQSIKRELTASRAAHAPRERGGGAEQNRSFRSLDPSPLQQNAILKHLQQRGRLEQYYERFLQTRPEWEQIAYRATPQTMNPFVIRMAIEAGELPEELLLSH